MKNKNIFIANFNHFIIFKAMLLVLSTGRYSGRCDKAQLLTLMVGNYAYFLMIEFETYAINESNSNGSAFKKITNYTGITEMPDMIMNS